MATEVVPASVGQVRATSTAGGGTALTTTAALIHILNGAKQIQLIPRLFVTAVVVKFCLNPYLAIFKTADNLATITDYSAAAQDNATGTDVVLSSLTTAASGGYLYVGGYRPIRGLRVDMDAANGTVSVMTGFYWNGAWASISLTDGTTSGGATLAIDGDITWTLPTDWVPASLTTIASPAPAAGLAYALDSRIYWSRFQVSVALDSSTTLNSILALNATATYAELPSGVAWEQRCDKALGGIGCIEALTDAGTASLIVNVVAANQGAVG